MLGQSCRTLSAGGKNTSIQQINHSRLFSGEKSCHGRLLNVKFIIPFRADDHDFLQILYLFKGNDTGHNLRQRRREYSFILPKLRHHLPVLQPDNNS